MSKRLIEKDNVRKIKTLRSLLSYRLINGSAMYLANDWYEGDISKHLLSGSSLSSQAISIFLRELGSNKLFKRIFLENIFLLQQKIVKKG